MSDEIFQPSLMYDGHHGERGIGHVKSSDTSKAWATHTTAGAVNTQQRIMERLARAGHRGMTAKELEDALGLTHQTVSASLRNMELDGYNELALFNAWNCGKVVKLEMTRLNQHAYVTKSIAYSMKHSELKEPNPRRASYKTKYDGLVTDLKTLYKEMDYDSCGSWYTRLNEIIEKN
tara:strand:- start:1002 stop:1532 length:531 start_codon:yes stop_codon:yes gene_type:complete